MLESGGFERNSSANRGPTQKTKSEVIADALLNAKSSNPQSRDSPRKPLNSEIWAGPKPDLTRRDLTRHVGSGKPSYLGGEIRGPNGESVDLSAAGKTHATGRFPWKGDGIPARSNTIAHPMELSADDMSDVKFSNPIAAPDDDRNGDDEVALD